MTRPDFNGLTPEQAECLALLVEEAAEVIQVVGKILRHGLYSTHPNGGADNAQLLERELGDLMAAVELASNHGILIVAEIADAKRYKLSRVGQYLHHAKVSP